MVDEGDADPVQSEPCQALPKAAPNSVFGVVALASQIVRNSEGELRKIRTADRCYSRPGPGSHRASGHHEFPDRGDRLTIDYGRRQVTQAALDWLGQRSA